MDASFRTLAAALSLESFTVPVLAATADVPVATVRTILNRNRQYFDAEAIPSGRRGGQVRMWRVRADARGELEQRLKGIDARFVGPEETDLILSEDGWLASSASRRTRGPESHLELVTADELHSYDSAPASGLLPRLVLRLLLATPGLSGLSMRTGEGIRLPSFDGRVEATDRPPFVPGGYSVWELSADKKVLRKANADLSRRSAAPGEVDPIATTFVFVSIRRSDKLESWARTQASRGIWRDVRAIDADGLYAWLLNTRPVHVWLSEQMGLRPHEVATLEGWFSSWCAQTDPAFPPRLLLAGRASEAGELREAVGRTGQVVGIFSNSRRESLAFAAAEFLYGALDTETPAGNARLASTLIIKTPDEWSRAIDNMADGILVPDFDGADVAAAARRGLTVVLPMGLGDDPSRATVVLPRLNVVEAIEQFQKNNVPIDEADRCAQEIDRSLPSFRRSHAINPTFERPVWANEFAELVAALTLVGGWDGGSEADQEAITSLTRRSYESVEQDLQRLATREDPPFFRSGGGWQLASPEDAFSLVGGVLTRGLLDRWFEIAREVLGEPNPAQQLDASEAFDIRMKGERRRYSSALRHGIARGAALLGTFDRRLEGAVFLHDYADRLTRELLGCGGEAWISLADVLPSLAEASPDEFLLAAQDGLDGEEPLLGEMFRDQDSPPIFGGGSPHSELLWALELLALAPEHAADACYILARLAAIDPGGRLSNRPAESLNRILLPWYPQVGVGLDARLEIVKHILEVDGHVGWNLVLGLLPSPYGASHKTYRAAFRPWGPPSTTTTGDVLAGWSAYAALALSQALRDPSKWVQLIETVAALPPVDRDKYLEALECIDVMEWSDEVRFSVWSSLTQLTARHRQFPDAQWVMPDSDLARLEAVAAKWEPDDPVERSARLFVRYPDIPDARRFSDNDEYEEKIRALRQTALQDILETTGQAGLDRLIDSSREPDVVGGALADFWGSDGNDFFDALGDAGPRGKAAIGWLWRSLWNRGDGWVRPALDRIRYLDETARTNAYVLMRGWSQTIDAVATEPARIQTRFWEGAAQEFHRCDDVRAVTDGLLTHGHPLQALQFLGYKAYQGSVPQDLVLAALKTAAGEPAELFIDPMIPHHIGSLLDRLEVEGAGDDVLADLEWMYFGLLQYLRPPRALFGVLAKRPEQFVELVCSVFRKAHDASDKGGLDPKAAALARASYVVLHEWKTPPGTSSDGLSIDGAALRAWVSRAQTLLADADRRDVGDELIGQLLAGAPDGRDGIWPAEPVRDLIEETPSKHLREGLEAGRFNARGITTRGTGNGGAQERELMDQYSAWAKEISTRWPRTARILRDLAITYRTWAAREDSTSERWRDAR
jgi:hypothetical protein